MLKIWRSTFLQRAGTLLSLLVILLSPKTAGAQQALTLDALEIQLWPEYDQPAVLVIYRILLPEDAQFPLSLAFRIPAAAGEPNAVAERGATGGLINVGYEREVEGEWATIRFNVQSNLAQLEYYDPGLKVDNSTRTYEFIYPGDYAVNLLQFQVQQPWDASGMSITPSLGTGQVEGDGLTYYAGSVGGVEQGQSYSLAVSYTKASETLTVSYLNSGTSSSTLGDFVPWVLAGVGAGLLLAGAYRYWGEKQRPQRRAKKRRTKPAAARGAYCHNCGAQAETGDVFCRNCGTKLRKE